MTKTIKITAILLAALIIGSCTNDDIPSPPSSNGINAKASFSVARTSTKSDNDNSGDDDDETIPYDAQISHLTVLIFNSANELVSVIQRNGSQISIEANPDHYEVIASLPLPESFVPETYTMLAYANVSNQHFVNLGITDESGAMRPGVDITFTENVITLKSAKQASDAGELIPMYGVLEAKADPATGGFDVGGVLRRAMARINLKVADAGVVVTGNPPAELGDFQMHRAYLYFSSQYGNITHKPDDYGQYVLNIPKKVSILSGKETTPQTANFADGVTQFDPIYTYEYDANFFTDDPLLVIESSFSIENKPYTYFLSIKNPDTQEGISIYRNTEYDIEITHVPYPDDTTPPVVPVNILYKIVIKPWETHEIPLPDYW